MLKNIKIDNNIRRLFGYFFKYWRRFTIAIISAILISSFDAALPALLGKVIDVISGKKGVAPTVDKIFGYLHIGATTAHIVDFFIILTLVMLVFKVVFSFINNYLMAFINKKLVFEIRSAMISRLLLYKMRFFDKNKTGDTVSRFTNDLVILDNTTSTFKTLIQSFAYVIIILTVMFIRHFRLTLLTLIIFPSATYVMKVLGKKIKNRAVNTQQHIAYLTNLLQEIISGIRIIKIFVKEKYESAHYIKENKKNYDLNMRLARVDARIGPLLEFVSYFPTIIIIWYGTILVLHGVLTVGKLVEFVGLAVLLYKPVKNLGSITSFVQRASVSAGRVVKIIDYADVEMDDTDKILPADVKGEVEFNDVSFAYNNRNKVLKHITFHIKAGHKIAIVGASGSGKSTIAALLFRLYDINEGSISIDGTDIREIRRDSLRKIVGLVPQDTFLFSTSIFENIRYGRSDAAPEEVYAAAKTANAHKFIEQLPNGYDTQVGERGVQLSGGERQRVAIARTLLKNPKILVLDEATSSLDAKSEGIVQEALDKLSKNRTTITIAHRLSTIINSDTIFLINNGEIVEHGTHEELLKQKGLYQQLCKSQYITE